MSSGPVVIIEDPRELRQRNVRYVMIIFVLLGLAGVSAITNLVLIKAWLNRKPDLVATTADLRVIPVVKVSRAVVSQSRLEEFTQKAWRTIYSFSFRTMDDSLLQGRPYFCGSAFGELSTSMNAIYDRVKAEKLVVSWIPLKGPSVTNSTQMDDGRYQYTLEGLAQVRYEGRSEEVHSLKYKTIVNPVDDIDNPFGVCIERFNFLPAGTR